MLENTLIIGNYQFAVSRHQDNFAGLMQSDVFYQTATTDLTFVRSFYFDEVTPQHIALFCERVATDAPYRQQAFARTTDWAIRDDLFLRNCANPYFQANPALEEIGSLVKAFYFFDEHVDAITKRPEYQSIQQRDTMILPHPHQPDPKIAPVIDKLNQIDGVQTLASCQGVSGVVNYNDIEIMTVSPHARYAYIWFATLPDNLAGYFADAENIRFANNIYPTLQSAGNNTAFLRDCETILDVNFSAT